VQVRVKLVQFGCRSERVPPLYERARAASKVCRRAGSARARRARRQMSRLQRGSEDCRKVLRGEHTAAAPSAAKGAAPLHARGGGSAHHTMRRESRSSEVAAAEWLPPAMRSCPRMPLPLTGSELQKVGLLVDEDRCAAWVERPLGRRAYRREEGRVLGGAARSGSVQYNKTVGVSRTGTTAARAREVRRAAEGGRMKWKENETRCRALRSNQASSVPCRTFPRRRSRWSLGTPTMLMK